MTTPKKIKIILFASALNDQIAVLEARTKELESLNRTCPLHIVSIDEYDGHSVEEEVVISFIATGGSEEHFLAHRRKLPRPWIFLSDGLFNSLAATQEITTWTYQNQKECIHIHSFEALSMDRISFIYQLQNAFRFMQTRRIGVFGDPSPWLISSQIDHKAISKKWGVAFVPVSMEQMKERCETIFESVKSHTKEIANSVIFKAIKIDEPSREDIEGAINIYLTLSEVCVKEKLNALTIRCFEALFRCQNTPCLALSRLNDQGIIAGCEGDMPSLWSMLLIKAITQKNSFMANFTDVHVEDQILDLSHCTVPLNMCDSYTLRNHFESGVGVGIQGHFGFGRFTIFKCGGALLDRYFVTEADFIEEPLFTNRCRTQMRFRTDRPVKEILESHLGNHLIIVKGEHKRSIDAFMTIFGGKPC